MTRLPAITFVIAALGFCGLASALGAENPAPNGRLDLRLCASKPRYICGEPIVLRTMVVNPSQATFTSSHPTIGWRAEDEFGIEIAPGKEGQFKSIWDNEVMRSIKATTPPIEYDDIWTDRHWIPGKIEAGAHYDRVDLLVLPNPGQYRLRATIIEDDKTRFVSPPVSVEVVPLSQAKDSIASQGDQVFATRLGRALVMAHYLQDILGGTGPEGSLNREEFDRVAPTIIEQETPSAFRETVMYADIMDWHVDDHLLQPAIERSKVLAERFIKEYPGSFLLPDVYLTLFWCHVHQKEFDKAAAVRATAVQKFPHASVLWEARQCDLEKFKK